MYVVSVTVYVKPERVEEFIAATHNNATNSWKEPGCLRFDVAQVIDTPTQFLLYEVYESEDAFKAHQQTAHYHTWREAVADWMAEPRKGVRHTNLFFTEK